MGRFYRTSGANPLDYMFELNTPLLERVVQANDQYIDQSMSGLNQLDQLANFNHIAGDDEDAKAVTKQYADQIEGITNNILKDPANWRNSMNPMRDLSKKLQEDYKGGIISKQVGNYNRRKEAFDAADKQLELWHTSGGTKGADPARVQAYKADWDSKFTKTGYNPETGAYNVYQGGSLMDNIDVKKVLADGLDKIKADKTNQYHEDLYGNGVYFNKVTNKEEYITPEKIINAASGNMSQALREYLAQDQAVGLIDGAVDEKGNMISPFTYSDVGLSPKEKAAIDLNQRHINSIKDPAIKKEMQDAHNEGVRQLNARQKRDWNEKSYLAPILKGLVNTYSYSSTESGNDLSNNSAWNTMYTQTQANKRNSDNLSMRWKIHDDLQTKTDKRFNDRLAWDIRKVTEFGIGLPKDAKGASGVKPKGVVGPDGKEVATDVSRFATNSFASWNTKDKNNETVPVLSTQGLSADIDKKKEELGKVDKQLAEVNKNLAWVAEHGQTPTLVPEMLKLEKERLTKNRTVVQDELHLRRKWYETSISATLDNHTASGVNLQKDQLELFNKHRNDPDGNWYKDRLKELNTEIARRDGGPSMPDPALLKDPTYKANKERLNNLTLEKTLLEKEWQSYRAVKATVDKGRENFLTNMRKDIIDTDAIALGTKESKDVSESLLNGNIYGAKLFDAFGRNVDNSLEGKGISWFNSAGDNYRLTNSDMSLKDYMDRYHVDMTVRKVGNTTNIGSGGAVAEVTFNDPNGGIPSDKVFYMELTPEMQKTVVTKFKDHKNPEVANIAKMIGDDEANGIKRQLMKPSLNKVLGQDGKEDASFQIVVSDHNGDDLPLRVTRTTDGASTRLFVTDMNNKALPSKNGIPGSFGGNDDFIQQYREQRQAKIDGVKKKG